MKKEINKKLNIINAINRMGDHTRPAILEVIERRLDRPVAEYELNIYFATSTDVVDEHITIKIDPEVAKSLKSFGFELIEGYCNGDPSEANQPERFAPSLIE